MPTIGKALSCFVFMAVSHIAAGQASMSIQMKKPQQPVIGLPFSADQSVRTVQHLANGTPLTTEMKGHVYRSSGGIERYDGATVSSDPANPGTTMIFILDIVKHTAVLLNTKLRTATIEHLPSRANVSIKFLPLQQRRYSGAAIKQADQVTADLGTRTQGTMVLAGKRITATIPAGKFGNDQPLYVTTDEWVDPKLQLLVNQVEQNPLAGERTFELTNIRSEEPDPALFEIPTGYTVKDMPQMPSGLPDFLPPPPRASVPLATQIQDALNGADPLIKNDLAYSLAQDNDHLADAETLAQEAVKLMEQETADVASRKDSDASYAQTVKLTSYWDTLGWVYYRQKKLEQAERYILAAWEIKPNPEYALHLGSIYEAQDRPKEAAIIYRMALSARNSPIQRDDFQTRLARLGETDDESLPIEVTAPLPSLDLHLVPADERLVEILVLPTGLPLVTYPNGEPPAGNSVTQAIQAALAKSLPDNGPETILRRARVMCAQGQTPACELHFLSPDKIKTASAGAHLPKVSLPDAPFSSPAAALEPFHVQPDGLAIYAIVSAVMPKVGGSPVKGLPFSAKETVVCKQTLADGTTIRSTAEVLLRRDAEGRMRGESALKSNNGEMGRHEVSVGDPIEGTVMTWISNSQSHSVIVMHLPGHKRNDPLGALASTPPPPPPPPPLPPGTAPQPQQGAPQRVTLSAEIPHIALPQYSANIHTETLPPEIIAGLHAEGTRTTQVIPARTAGNDRRITVISETWISPDLKITVRQITDDPRTGKVTTEINSIDRSNPDPALFKIPEGYTVMEMPTLSSAAPVTGNSYGPGSGGNATGEP